MKAIKVLCVIGAIASAVASQKVSYEGFKVWSVNPIDKIQGELVIEWENYDGIDIWERRLNQPMRIMVAPEKQNDFLEFLDKNEVPHELSIENVEPIFEEERRQQENATRYSSGRATVNDFHHFWSLAEIYNYLTYLATYHSDIVSTEVIGYSFQGRLIRAVKISAAGRGNIDGSRPIVFIDSGIHAREWAAHMAGVYFLFEIIERRALGNLLQNIDIFIIPVANPDGYVWSHTNARLWRKTRATIAGSTCLGVDGNRNYGHMWQRGTAGACSEVYPGLAPFTEPETRAVRDVLLRYGSSVKIYNSLHSFGNYVLYPWGYDFVYINTWQHHDHVGRLFANAIQASSGTVYTVGNAAFELYTAFGASDDYAGSLNIPISFTFELPAGGLTGFDLPANRIFAVVTETWTGFNQVLRYAATTQW